MMLAPLLSARFCSREASSSYDLMEENDSLMLRSLAIFLLLWRRQACWMKHADQYRNVCCSFLLWRRLNWLATNLRSSARRANASTSKIAFTVRVDDGKLTVGLGTRAHPRSSSPQKSPGLRVIELKKPVRPPSVVELSSLPRMINNISVTGSPSRTIYVPSIQAKVALDVTTKICRQGLQYRFFIHASSCKPLVMNESSHPFLQFGGQLSMSHPLL
ncbi:hypothetical protein U9M48_029502, partial [Paspalum notatum var. saurae]